MQAKHVRVPCNTSHTAGIPLWPQVREGWTAANSLVADTSLDSQAAKFKVTKQVPTPTLRLSHLIDAIPPTARFDMLKIDVQGVNYNVITSAGEEIKRARCRAPLLGRLSRYASCTHIRS
jgi:FkbM family methyltransferase